MINYQYESLFRQDSIDKQIHITGDGISLDNSLIFQGSFELDEAIDTNDDLMFGSIYSSSLKFTTSDVESSFIGKSLAVTMTVDNHSTDDFTVGTYKVEEEKWTANRTKKEIVAYDSLYDAINKDVTDWYNALTFPMTLATFRHSFFTHVGITEKTTSLINDDMTLQKGINPSRLLGGEVIRAICQINGCFGRMTRDNKFDYKVLSSISVYNVTPSMYTECKFEDYTVNQIDKVIIRQEENDIGGSYGSGDNALIIQGNFLVYGLENGYETIAQNILSVVGSITYTPAEISCIGNPCVEVGDLITVSRTNGQTFQTYVLSRKLNNIQSIKDQYTSFGNESRMNDSYLYDNEWLQLLGKTNKLTRTVDETISEVGELGNAVTTIRQDTDSLEIQVQSMQEQLDGETQYYERHGEPTLLNYPYWDFTRGIPCNNTIVLDAIYDDKMHEGGSRYPHFTYYDEDLKNYMRALCIDLDTGNGYRFIQENGVWTWKQIADSDFSILYNQIAELNIEVDGIEERVSNTELTVTSLGQQVSTNTTNISTTASGLSAEITRATTIEGNLSNSVNTNSQNIGVLSDNLGNEINRATEAETLLSTSITATASAITTQVAQTYQTIADMDNYYDSNYIDGHYYTQNQSNNRYYTQTQTNSLINQSASSITATVSQNYYNKTTSDNRYYASSDATILIGRVSDVEGDITDINGDISNINGDITDMNDPTKSGSLANQITAKVSDTYGNNQSAFSWVLKSTGFDVKNSGTSVFKVNSSGVEVTGNIKATSGQIGSGNSVFTIGNKAIYNGVTSMSDTTHNGIYLGTDGIRLGKGNFSVTSAGALTMNSGSISLGSGVFTVNNNGYLTATSGRISSWDIYQYGLNCHNDVFPDDSLLIGLDSSTTPIRDYQISANRKLTIYTSGVLNLVAGSTFATVTGNIINKDFAQHVALVASDQKFEFSTYGTSPNTYWRCVGGSDGIVRLGDSDRRWGQIYSTNSTIATSDRKEKKYIKPLRKSAREFIMNLNPVSYQFKNGESGRTHYGLIAQDVEETMKDLGMTDLDFAGFCKDEKGDDYIYGLRYEEFIAPMIKTIQLQQEEIEELKRRVGTNG